MVFWILAGIGAYLINLYFAATLMMLQVGPVAYMGPRDNLPQTGIYQERARKSAANFMENLPIFLVLGLLALVVDGTDQAMAIFGAQIFVVSRLVYLAVYVSGVPFIRSGMFAVGMTGLVLMGVALF